MRHCSGRWAATTANNPLNSLASVLDAEEDALLTGDFDAIDALVPEKERLVGLANEASSQDEAAWKDVRQKITRNQKLLESAMNGVRTVALRMQELDRARNRFDTYDQTGQRQSVDTRTKTSLEKRV